MEKYIQIILSKEEKQRIENIKKKSLNKWIKLDKIEKIKQSAFKKQVELIYKDLFNHYDLSYKNLSLFITTKDKRYSLHIEPHYYGKGLRLSLSSKFSRDFILLDDKDIWNPSIIINYFEIFINREEHLNLLLNIYEKSKKLK
jgi:hypothetical protein